MNVLPLPPGEAPMTEREIAFWWAGYHKGDGDGFDRGVLTAIQADIDAVFPATPARPRQRHLRLVAS